jgi:hypothetical protein
MARSEFNLRQNKSVLQGRIKGSLLPGAPSTNSSRLPVTIVTLSSADPCDGRTVLDRTAENPRASVDLVGIGAKLARAEDLT